jgi:hypothetical protein
MTMLEVSSTAPKGMRSVRSPSSLVTVVSGGSVVVVTGKVVVAVEAVLLAVVGCVPELSSVPAEPPQAPTTTRNAVTIVIRRTKDSSPSSLV